jgi:hypothetical protein
MSLPIPTLQAAIAELQHRDEFRVILQFIKDERERFFGDLRQAESPNDVMKLAGSVATLDELLLSLSPP